jgi:hypothetical protein
MVLWSLGNNSRTGRLACGLSNHGVVSSGKQQLEADDKLASGLVKRGVVKHGVDQQQK